MLRGLAKPTWPRQIKIFVREPLGVVGTILVPVARSWVKTIVAEPVDANDGRQPVRRRGRRCSPRFSCSSARCCRS